MALTNDILNQNAMLATLTDEQKSAIVTLSKNDEDTVIATKVGEIYGGLDNDILATSGIAKDGTEKTYVYAKRVIGDLKAKADASAALQTQISDKDKEITRLNKVIAEGGADGETAKQLKQAKADLASVTKDYNALNTKYQEQEQRHCAESEGYHRALGKARHEECDKRHKGYRHCVWQLGSDVVDVLTLCACRRHDGGVGDG